MTIVDGSKVATDAFQAKGHRPMMVSGAVLHSLPSGYRFDLRTRTLIPQVSDITARQERIAESATRRLRRMSRQIAAEGANSFSVERRRGRDKKPLPEASE